MENYHPPNEPEESAEAFAERICSRYYEFLLIYAFAQTRKFAVDPSLAWDILHDELMKCRTKFHIVKQGYTEKGVAYFRKMIFNGFLQEVRKQKSIVRLGDMDQLDVEVRSGDMYHLCVKMHTDDFKEQLSKFIQGRDLELMCLYIDGYKYQEIAEILGMTETNVGARISRIKKKLSNDLRDYWPPL